ncbi:hypothetical protein ACJX0J_026828, partial [Zea mays]
QHNGIVILFPSDVALQSASVWFTIYSKRQHVRVTCANFFHSYNTAYNKVTIYSLLKTGNMLTKTDKDGDD